MRLKNYRSDNFGVGSLILQCLVYWQAVKKLKIWNLWSSKKVNICENVFFFFCFSNHKVKNIILQLFLSTSIVNFVAQYFWAILLFIHFLQIFFNEYLNLKFFFVILCQSATKGCYSRKWFFTKNVKILFVNNWFSRKI